MEVIQKSPHSLTGRRPHSEALCRCSPLRPLSARSPARRSGFTLVEVMIVLAIIGMLASIAVPNYIRARKRAQATRIVNDLRLLDSAVEQYSLERSKPAGTVILFADLKSYLKNGTALYSNGQDLFGNNYGPFVTDSIPKVSASTFGSLSDVAPAEFWSPYY